MSPLRKDITMPSSRLGPGGSSSAAFDEPRMTDSTSKSVIYCLIQIYMSGSSLHYYVLAKFSSISVTTYTLSSGLLFEVGCVALGGDLGCKLSISSSCTRRAPGFLNIRSYLL